MNDQDIESLLRRYRPVARISEFPSFHISKSERVWPWAVAAAALLAVTIGLHAAVVTAPDTVPVVDGTRVQAIAEGLGGGAESRIMADWIARREAAFERERQALTSDTEPERR